MNIDTNIDPYIFFIDNILDNHLDTINYIFQDFKNRFSLTPFFLGNLKITDLTNFIIDLYKSNKNTHTYLNSIQNTFLNYYNSELNISYNIINNFLKNKIHLHLQYNNWVKFCYHFSDLYELLFLNY